MTSKYGSFIPKIVGEIFVVVKILIVTEKELKHIFHSRNLNNRYQIDVHHIRHCTIMHIDMFLN